jgi:hypothetical protein
MSDTPETDAAVVAAGGDWSPVLRAVAQRLERQRDEVRAELREWQTLCLWGGTPEHIHDFIKGQQTRIHEAQDIEKTCEQLENERERLDEALMAIEDVFVDGEDTYEDWKRMGNIARAALEHHTPLQKVT